MWSIGSLCREHHRFLDDALYKSNAKRRIAAVYIGNIIRFLLIDIIVASVTLSIGMVQLPPAMVSAPFKILLFVLVDGWNLTIGSLMKGFAT